MRKLLIAGGGTGGHLFSGLAVAEEWVARGGDVLFVGSRRGIEQRMVPAYGYRLKTVAAGQFKGTGPLQSFAALLFLGIGILQSLVWIAIERPSVVLGIGGYASGPAVLAAWLCGKKRAILDQNSIPGVMNRLLGRFVPRIFLTYEESIPFFRKEKCRVTGNPVIRKRRNITSLSPSDPPGLLVCGGSQGAQAVNSLLLEAVGDIVRELPSLKLVHQTGESDSEKVSEEIRRRGIRAEVFPFIEAIEEKYANSHLVVSRAGAGTLSELALWGKPAILIPYPHAADNHQQRNAEIFERRGAAVVLKQEGLTGERLAGEIIGLLKDRVRLEAMARQARTLAHPDAAERVVEELQTF